MKKILHDFIWNNLALCSFRFHILAYQVYILSNTLEGFTPRDYHGHISSLVYINIGWKLLEWLEWSKILKLGLDSSNWRSFNYFLSFIANICLEYVVEFGQRIVVSFLIYGRSKFDKLHPSNMKE